MGWLFIQWLYFTTDIHKVTAVVGKYGSDSRIAAVEHPHPHTSTIKYMRKVKKEHIKVNIIH